MYQTWLKKDELEFIRKLCLIYKPLLLELANKDQGKKNQKTQKAVLK